VRVLHVITSLGQGGAEGVLYRLVSASPPGIEHIVVSLMADAYYAPRLRTRGVEVHALNEPRGRIGVSSVVRLRRLLARMRPDIVQTWMYHADLVGGLVARWAGVRSVIWGIRNSNLDGRSSISARTIARICARLSGWLPAGIACCSVRAARVHQALGYPASKLVVIPNGCDVSRFDADGEARASVRAQWGVLPDDVLLGMVARWDAQKDHANLLRALVRLDASGPRLRCALVGTGMDRDNRALATMLAKLGLTARTILAGPREDIPAVMNALDLHVLSSCAEAFPNVVTEAMACGTPCVVTDVGDAALIVGATGWVVPPRDAAALAGGIDDALATVTARGRAELGRACRTRVEDHFGLGRMVEAYQALWRQVATRAARGLADIGAVPAGD
jgi:glycosyltransferase involved in cell wall biosynthesis